MDGPRTFKPSDSVLPGRPIIQHNKSAVHNGQLKHSDLSASIVDIKLELQILYRKDTKAQRKRSSVAYVVARSQLHCHERRLSIDGSSLS